MKNQKMIIVSKWAGMLFGKPGGIAGKLIGLHVLIYEAFIDYQCRELRQLMGQHPLMHK